MRIIGLTGRAHAGKDTVAQFILDAAHHGPAKREGFADRLKLSAARLFHPQIELDAAIEFCNDLKDGGLITASTGLLPFSISGREFLTGLLPFSISGREFLQRYGTEAHRDVFGEDFWLDAVLPEGRADCNLLVIPDVRFENEALRVHDRGGEVWRVVRPGEAAVEAHASEGGIPDDLVDFVVVNDGSLDDLRAQVLEAL